MKQCKGCGKDLLDQERYCHHCGQGLTEDKGNPSWSQLRPTSIKTTHRKRKLWIGVGGLSGFFVIVFISVFLIIGGASFGTEGAIDTFEEAVLEQDIDRLSELLVSGSPNMKLDEEELKQFAKFLVKTNELGPVVDQLKKQASEGHVEESGAYLELKKSEKRWLFFDSYKLIVKPTFITIRVNLEGAEIYKDDERIGSAEHADYAAKYGPYMPGEYQFSARLQGEYSNLSVTRELRLTGVDAEVKLTLDGEAVQINTDQPGAVVVINGVSTGKTVSELQGRIGPIALDGSVKVKLEMEVPWGKVDSEEVSIESDVVNLPVTFINEELAAQIMERVNRFELSWEQAYSERNPALLEGLTEGAEASLAADLRSMEEQKLLYTGRFVKASYSMSSLKLRVTGNGYEAQITGSIIFDDAAFYYEGDSPVKQRSETITTFHLKYDALQQQWLIYTFYVSEYMQMNDTKSFEFAVQD